MTMGIWARGMWISCRLSPESDSSCYPNSYAHETKRMLLLVQKILEKLLAAPKIPQSFGGYDHEPLNRTLRTAFTHGVFLQPLFLFRKLRNCKQTNREIAYNWSEAQDGFPDIDGIRPAHWSDGTRADSGGRRVSAAINRGQGQIGDRQETHAGSY